MIAAARTDLYSVLTDAGLTAYGAWPAQPITPCVLVVPPSTGSYVESGKTVATEYLVYLDAVCLVRAGPRALDDLDMLIDAVLATTSDTYGLSSVDGPATLGPPVVQSELLGAVVHLAVYGNL